MQTVTRCCVGHHVRLMYFHRCEVEAVDVSLHANCQHSTVREPEDLSNVGCLLLHDGLDRETSRHALSTVAHPVRQRVRRTNRILAVCIKVIIFNTKFINFNTKSIISNTNRYLYD